VCVVVFHSSQDHIEIGTHDLDHPISCRCKKQRQCYNDSVKLIIDLIPVKHNMPKDLYKSKKIVSSLKMKYKRIDACKKICMLFWKEHKGATECMHCGRSRYVKAINKDGTSITTKVVVKQLRYIPITPRMK
jgi:hypothetical protein